MSVFFGSGTFKDSQVGFKPCIICGESTVFICNDCTKEEEVKDSPLCLKLECHAKHNESYHPVFIKTV